MQYLLDQLLEASGLAINGFGKDMDKLIFEAIFFDSDNLEGIDLSNSFDPMDEYRSWSLYEGILLLILMFRC